MSELFAMHYCCRPRLMVETGCTANLLRIVEHLWNAAATSSEELEHQEAVIADCLNALMNLTTDVDNQVSALTAATLSCVLLGAVVCLFLASMLNDSPSAVPLLYIAAGDDNV